MVAQWLYLGGNLIHLPKAVQTAPVSHTLFYSSIVALEGTFFLYYTSWNLFKTLPVLAALGTITFLSGSRALSEVQERRLSGLR
jgi:oligosaccharyltransferase complex subunit delta (ribophorin II)